MKRSWINRVATVVFVGSAAFVGSASAHHGGGFGGGFGGGGFSGGIRNAVSHGNHGGHNLGNQVHPVLNKGPLPGKITPINNNKPINIGGIGGVNGGGKPTLPKFPTGPIKSPIGNGGVVGPIKPPHGGSGPIVPPSGGGKHCHHGVGPIVLGCLPCVGGGGYYGGGYYPPVYTQPVATTTVVPVVTTAPVAEQVAVIQQPAVTPAVATTPVIETSVEKLPEVPVGSTITLNGTDLGAKGQALLVIDKLTIGVHVDEWTADHATATLPPLTISAATTAEIVLVKADGYAASTVKVQLVPAVQPATDNLGSVASLTR